MGDAVDVVRLLLCVQSQDAPLARFSVGIRTTGADDVMVRAALDSGRIVRTHILRPTWHYVAAEDLRWILALTSAKVESGMAARHLRLAIDASVIDHSIETLQQLLRGREFRTVPEIGVGFGEVGLSSIGETVRDLLLVAELRGIVCSGPLRGNAHTYGLVDELVAPTPTLERSDAARTLVHRFFAGHGPSSERDLLRWTTLTLSEIRAAITDLGDTLESLVVDDITFWFDPTLVMRDRPHRAFLLPTFDEAYLSFATLNVGRMLGHPRGDEPHRFAEAGGGVVICDRHDAGWWKRTQRAPAAMTIALGLAPSLDDEQRALITVEATRLATFFGREPVIEYR